MINSDGYHLQAGDVIHFGTPEMNAVENQNNNFDFVNSDRYKQNIYGDYGITSINNRPLSFISGPIEEPEQQIRYAIDPKSQKGYIDYAGSQSGIPNNPVYKAMLNYNMTQIQNSCKESRSL